MADHGDEPSGFGAALERAEGLVEGVGVEAAEALVEEEGLQASAAAIGELDETERQREADEECLAAGERVGCA